MRKLFLAFMVLVSLTIPSGKAHADIFGGDTAVLLKIMVQNIMQNMTLNRILGAAHDNLATLRGVLENFKRVFGGTDMPHDYVPWEQGNLDEISYKGDTELEQVFRNLGSANILQGKSLDQLIYVIKNTWDLTTHLPDEQMDKQDAVATLAALQSLDSGRRSNALLPGFNDSLESILPEINTATPGRAIQLNTHLNFLQAAGFQHLLENQSAETKIAAIDLLNQQEKEKESVKASKDIYSALAEVVSKEIKPK